MANQPKYEKIEAYLNGTLPPTEYEVFEQEIQSNPKLAEQVQLFREIDKALEDEGALNFQKVVQAEEEAFLKEFEKEVSEEENSKPLRKIGGFNRQWMMAASFLIFLFSAFLLWQFQPSESSSNEELFAQYVETYPLNEDVRGNDSTATNFEIGIQQYQAKDFDAAVQTFESLAATNGKDMSLAFSLGNAYLNQTPPQFILAEQQFRKIITNDSSIYVSKAKWYVALILLQKGELTEAKNLLKDVTESGDKYGRKAEELLKELRN